MKSTFKSNSTFGKKKAKVSEIDSEIAYKSETPDIESDSTDEMNYIMKSFQDIKNKEIDQFKRLTDANFYFGVYFADTEQKDEFINAINAAGLFDPSHRFIAGKDLAKLLKIELKERKLKRAGYFGKGKRFDFKDF
jgi:hypothetical protein